MIYLSMKHGAIAILMLIAFGCKKGEEAKPTTDDVVYKVTCDSCEIWFANDSIDKKIIQNNFEYSFKQPQGDHAVLLSVGAWEKKAKRKIGLTLSIFYSGELVQQYTDNNLSDTTPSPASIYYTIPKKDN